MQIYESRYKVKCDFAGCRNVADYTLVKDGVFKRDICLCKECLDEIYEATAKVKVPKAIESPFKLNKRLKKDEK